MGPSERCIRAQARCDARLSCFRPMTGTGDCAPDGQGRREGQMLIDPAVRYNVAASALMARCGHCREPVIGYREIRAMKTRLLDPAEYKATFSAPMRDVSQTATHVIDIWPYVDAVSGGDLLGHELAAGLVEHVYRDGTETYDHVLVVTKSKNVFLAVVVDLMRDEILGHHLLDLNQEYGLLTPH